MDHRRFLTFLIFFLAFTFVYNGFIRPKFFPAPIPLPVPADGDANNDPAGDAGSTDPAIVDDGAPEELVIHPEQTVALGSLDPSSGFFLQADLTTQGASIEKVRLTDPKFRELHDTKEQVVIIGTNETDDRTFSTAVAAIDRQLKKHDLTLETAHWEVVSATPEQVQFSFEAPNHSLRVDKTFRLKSISAQDIRDAYTENAQGYTIELDVTVTNLTDQPQTVDYELQGPVGIVLENLAHTRKYRDIKLQFVGEDDDVTMSTKDLSGLYKQQVAQAEQDGQKLTQAELKEAIRQEEPWTGVFRYAGIDVQFFAALVAPLDQREESERLSNKWIDRTWPVMIKEDPDNVYESDISFRMASTPQKLEAAGGNDSVTHSYGFFVGPKRSTLLDQAPFEADRVLDIDTGFFNTISLGLVGLLVRLMHFLLGSFHSLGIPYGICIILLTVLVRGCMFPISRKQALSAARMKELQPKLNELKAKYGEDKQKFAQAQMELWRKYNINPLAGCLPVFFQMPIFIGLYQCLNTAVDLRLSTFLWIDNLAAPDAMFNFPFATPAAVGPHISVLPIVTVILFLTQQKMFMPPPADEQAEMTQKMMNMMTFMFGILFWHQPAGLCVYFICSSIWGITERKLLGNTKIDLDESLPSVVVKEPGKDSGGQNSSTNEAAPAKKGFFAKLMEAAEQAQKQAEQQREKERKGKGKGKNR